MYLLRITNKDKSRNANAKRNLMHFFIKSYHYPPYPKKLALPF